MPIRANYFDPGLLPPPSVFYRQELSKISRPNQKGWAMADCPFHKSSTHISLKVNLVHGGFHCFGCGKSGTMVGFYQALHHLSFAEAYKALAGVSTEGQHPEMLRQRERRRKREAEAQEEREREKHELERSARAAATNLLRNLELLWTYSTRNFQDDDLFYEYLSDLLGEIRKAEVEYGRWLDRAWRASRGLPVDPA